VIIDYWLEKANESLESAHHELRVRRLSFAVNRAYYACFYAASAALLRRNLRFKKHSGVRAAFHQNLVKTKALSIDLGRLYDVLFENPMLADYTPLASFEPERVSQWLNGAKGLVAALSELSQPNPAGSLPERKEVDR